MTCYTSNKSSVLKRSDLKNNAVGITATAIKVPKIVIFYKETQNSELCMNLLIRFVLHITSAAGEGGVKGHGGVMGLEESYGESWGSRGGVMGQSWRGVVGIHGGSHGGSQGGG